MQTKDNLKHEFDAFAVNYTEDMTKCVPYYLKLMKAFSVGYPENFKAHRILDLGCGNGNVTAQLIALFPQAHYTLLDASSDMLELCKNRFNDYNIATVCSYFKDYLFPKDNFDLVVAGFSLHHCSSGEKQQLFNSIQRSLTANGILACSDLMIHNSNPDHPNLIAFWKSFVLKNYPDQEKWLWLMEHYQKFDTPDNYNDQIVWLKKDGFHLIDEEINDTYWVHFKMMAP